MFDEENAILLEIETRIDPIVEFKGNYKIYTKDKASKGDVSSNAVQPSQVKKETRKRRRKQFPPIIQEKDILFGKKNRSEERIIEHNSVPPVQSMLFYKYVFQILGLN